jgi:catalase (peroxidase I)
MGTVKVKDHENNTREFKKLSDKDEALTLAIQELTKAIGKLRVVMNRG